MPALNNTALPAIAVSASCPGVSVTPAARDDHDHGHQREQEQPYVLVEPREDGVGRLTGLATGTECDLVEFDPVAGSDHEADHHQPAPCGSHYRQQLLGGPADDEGEQGHEPADHA